MSDKAALLKKGNQLQAVQVNGLLPADYTDYELLSIRAVLNQAGAAVHFCRIDLATRLLDKLNSKEQRAAALIELAHEFDTKPATLQTYIAAMRKWPIADRDCIADPDNRLKVAHYRAANRFLDEQGRDFCIELLETAASEGYTPTRLEFEAYTLTSQPIHNRESNTNALATEDEARLAPVRQIAQEFASHHDIRSIRVMNDFEVVVHSDEGVLRFTSDTPIRIERR